MGRLRPAVGFTKPPTNTGSTDGEGGGRRRGKGKASSPNTSSFEASDNRNDPSSGRNDTANRNDNDGFTGSKSTPDRPVPSYPPPRTPQKMKHVIEKDDSLFSDSAYTYHRFTGSTPTPSPPRSELSSPRPGGTLTSVDRDFMGSSKPEQNANLEIQPSPLGPKPQFHDSMDILNVWIGAENALQHLNKCRNEIAEEFSKEGIQPSEYALYAGFDDSLLRAGIGYLEQIHVFTSANIPPTSNSLLSRLGRIFSPFSSTLFTQSSQYRLPVYKSDNTCWEYDELVFHTAAKFADRGTTASMYPTIISLSQRVDGGGYTGFGAQSDPPGKGKEREGSNSGTGRGKGGGDKDMDENENYGHDGPGDPDADDPPDTPNEPEPETRPMKVSFEVTSEIYSTKLEDDRPRIFQFLTLEGDLTIQEPVPSTSAVRFNMLKSGSTTTTTPDTSYQQHHLRVTVDSRFEGNSVTVHQPQRTLAFDRENKVISGTKNSRTIGGNLGATLGLTKTASVNLAVNTARATELSAGLEKKGYTSRITQQNLYGVCCWGFDVDDPYERQGGINLSEDILPSVTFAPKLSSSSDPPRLDRVDVEVASYWSIIPQQKQLQADWLAKILSLSSSELGDVPFSNLCQILVLSIPQHPRQDSHYRAIVKVANGHRSFHSSVVPKDKNGPVEFVPTLTRRVGNEVIDYDDLVRESSLDLSSIRLAHRRSVTASIGQQSPRQPHAVSQHSPDAQE